MPRKNYYGRRGPSAGIIALNAFIISLLAVVIVLLAMYIYIYFSGNNFVKSLGVELPWTETESTVPKVIVPSAELPETSGTVSDDSSVSDAQDAVSQGTDVTSVSAQENGSAETSETVPKYNSTKYDKEFFDNTLFIGDSIFTGFSGFGYLLPENVFAQVGLNPESALTRKINDVTSVEKAAAMQPERICIMLGTNGLAYMGIDYMNTKMGELIDSLEGVCPDTDIIVLSIPPVTEEHDLNNPEKIPVIIEYNGKLAATADNKGCMFIDIFEMLQDENGFLAEEYAEADGLHFLGKAYGVVLSRIQYEIEIQGAEETVPTSAETEATAVTGVITETSAEETAETVNVIV